MYYYYAGATVPTAYLMSQEFYFEVEIVPGVIPTVNKLVLIGANSGSINFCTFTKEILDTASCGDATTDSNTACTCSSDLPCESIDN